jgi:predicted nucleic acid-binding protein
MANPTVYVETTVVGYLTSRPNNDPIVRGHQQVTREWWAEAPARFDLLTSELVVRECSGGDATAAEKRLQTLKSLPKIAANETAEKLTEALMRDGAVPQTEPRDAAHIALAASHGVQFLVTWNFRHIGNAQRWPDIERICRALGVGPPRICTPEGLLGKPAAQFP